MKRSNISKLILFFYIVLFLIDLSYRKFSTPVYKAFTSSKINDSFQGTFTTEENPFCYITIKESKEFFYFDDHQRTYFNGVISEVDSAYYELSSEYFGSQMIHYENLSFELFLDGELYTFEKISNTEMYGRKLEMN